MAADRPVAVAGLSDATDVAGTWGTSAALLANGEVWTWGDGGGGVLGNGTFDIWSLYPVQVLNLTAAREVAGGGGHFLVIESDGTVWAWGAGTSGQLGDGFAGIRNVPVQAVGIASAVAIGAGFEHTLAVTSDGAVWTWGRNRDGELGLGFVSFEVLVPTTIPTLAGRRFVAVAGGRRHSVALEDDGSVWTWGRNEFGQLGDGTNTSSDVPLRLGGLSGVVGIAAGGYHSLAIDGSGTVWGWGENSSGQLGDGTNSDRNLPVAVVGLSGALRVAGGQAFSLAIRAGFSGWSWGGNSSGQLGDGSWGPRNTAGLFDLDAPPPDQGNVLLPVREGADDVRLEFSGGSATCWRLFDDADKTSLGVTPLAPQSDTTAPSFIDIAAISRAPRIYYVVKGLSACSQTEGP